MILQQLLLKEIPAVQLDTELQVVEQALLEEMHPTLLQ